MHSDPSDILTSEFYLACVQAGARRQADLPGRIFECKRATHRATGPSKVARTPSPVVLIRFPRCFSIACFAMRSWPGFVVELTAARPITSPVPQSFISFETNFCVIVTALRNRRKE
jgi:hypothetical protein